MKRSALLVFLCLAVPVMGLGGAGGAVVHVSAASVSRHFGTYHDYKFNDFHLGLGIEAYYRKNNWLLGGNGHFMFNDSNNRASFWIGVAPGYFVGAQRKLWGTLALIVGGLKKNEYNGGRFSLFALPYLTVGFNRVGVNVGFIPRIARVTVPILLVQLKILIYPFRHLDNN